MKSLTYQSYLNWHTGLDDCLRAESEDLARQGAVRVLEAHDRSARLELERLDWDSEVLGLNAWHIRQAWVNAERNDPPGLPALLEELEGFLKAEKIRFCSLRVHSQYSAILTAFERRGWYEADRLKIYFSPLTAFKKAKPSLPDPLRVAVLREEDAVSFFERHPNLFSQGRVSRDPHFHGEKADRFYRKLFVDIAAKSASVRLGLWKGEGLIGVCLGESDAFLKRFAGFRLGYLWQIAVDPSERGNGYSRLLLEAFLHEMAKKVKSIEIGTQAENEAANRLYQGMGLELVSQAVTLHRFTD